MLNKLISASQPELLHKKLFQSPPQAALARQAFGHGDVSTATGSLGTHGPRSSDDNKNARRTIHTFPTEEDEHARSPIFFDFHVNIFTLKCLLGSIISGQRPTHLSASLPEYIAKQIPCQPSSHSKKMPGLCGLVHG